VRLPAKTLQMQVDGVWEGLGKAIGSGCKTAANAAIGLQPERVVGHSHSASAPAAAIISPPAPNRVVAGPTAGLQ